MWLDKNHPDCVYVDVRPEVNPTVVHDTRLPFPASITDRAPYDLINFDPPHMCCGPESDMATRYGHHTSEEIRQIVRLTAENAHSRIARQYGDEFQME